MVESAAVEKEEQQHLENISNVTMRNASPDVADEVTIFHPDGLNSSRHREKDETMVKYDYVQLYSV